MTLVPDFRLSHDGIAKNGQRVLLGIQEWVEDLRDDALALLDDLEESPPAIPGSLAFDFDTDPETAAQLARAEMSIPVEQQSCKTSQAKTSFPETLRDKIEALGILVLKSSDLVKAGARGMCISERPLPVIIFTNESPGAQAFTISHELGHVLLSRSGISGAPIAEKQGSPVQHQNVEVWCNRFSAALLIPADMLQSIYERPSRPQSVWMASILKSSLVILELANMQ